MFMNNSKGVVARPLFYAGKVNLAQRRMWFDGEGEPTETSAGEAQPTQPAVDWTIINPGEVPEDVIKAHPLYKRVLAESIERRQKLKAVLENEGEKQKAEPAQPEPVAPEGEVPTWAQALIGKLTAVEQFVQANQQTTLEIARAAAIKAYGLPEGAAKFLTGSTPTELETNAAQLAAAFNIPRTSAGNAGTQGGHEGLAARALERLKGGVEPLSEKGLFDVGVQKQHTGGTIR